MKKPEKVDCYCPTKSCVQIIEQENCVKECDEKPCLYVCPVGLFVEQGGEVVFDGSNICLECGACRLVCDNIRFDYPPGGRGVIYRFG